ncbi:cell division protein ZipA [Aidingimonas lacisalsi]|uniref:cell division protein ZipA n=1 Tax=Aidingimonas lacisalsi TaxID=2604086 RepID=UPI0011D28A6A|nr:cell division protein ZipA [Aidingimonas lacisalsi]
MELREWLIILGLALVTIIVIDGVRRLQRQRRVPRLDRADSASTGGSEGKEPVDPEQAAREAEVSWELPNGGARVIRPAEHDVKPKPKIKRQDHPGPSRVLSEWRRQYNDASSDPSSTAAEASPSRETSSPARESSRETTRAQTSRPAPEQQPRPEVAARDETAGTHAAVGDERVAQDRSDRSAFPPSPETESPTGEAAYTGVSADDDSAASDGDEARREPTLAAFSADEANEADAAAAPLSADPEDHGDYHDAERYRLVDVEGVTDSLKSKSAKVGASVQRFGTSLQKGLSERREHRKKHKLDKAQAKAEEQARKNSRRQQAQAEKDAREKEARLAAERERLEREAIDAQDYDDPLFVPRGAPSASDHSAGAHDDERSSTAEYARDGSDEGSPGVTSHPSFERVLRNDVNADHARETLVNAEEVIVISVMSHEEEGFSGAALLDLLLACGLRYSSDMGVFHRFETEDPNSELQFSMVNVVKPGTFPIQSMDDFRTPGVTLLMPLPCASDTLSSFEAMVETAMVVVRHLGGELKDENHSVMTAQTVEFARQRVQEFERRHRLHRYQAT